MFERGLKLVYFGSVAAAAVIRVFYARRTGVSRKQSENRPQGLEALFMALWAIGAQLFPLVFALGRAFDFANYQLPKPLKVMAGIIGTILETFGVLLLWRSHADLGVAWTPTVQTKEEQALITDGVFSRIRHPMYAAHFLMGLGQIFLIQNWVAGLSGLLTMIPVYLIRVPVEETAMIEHFGDEYQAYMETTGRIVPRWT